MKSRDDMDEPTMWISTRDHVTVGHSTYGYTCVKLPVADVVDGLDSVLGSYADGNPEIAWHDIPAFERAEMVDDLRTLSDTLKNAITACDPKESE
jgi:hypothetical protein